MSRKILKATNNLHSKSGLGIGCGRGSKGLLFVRTALNGRREWCTTRFDIRPSSLSHLY